MLTSITNLAQISQIRILNFLNQSNLITVNIHVIWKIRVHVSHILDVRVS